MQVRIGKTRCHGSLARTSGTKIACFLSIVTLFSSCSLFQTQKKIEIKKAFESLCLTSQGKGRIEYSGGRHVFTYESLWKPESNNWSMAFSLPVIGQELLSITLRDTEPLRLGVEGTFAKRLKNDIKNRNEQKLLQTFYGAIGRFLLVAKDPKDSVQQKGWTFKGQEGELLGEYPISKGATFTMRAFDLSEKFGRMQFVLRANKEMSLDLFVSKCSL